MGRDREAARRRAPRFPISLDGALVGRSRRDVTIVDLSLGGCLVRCDALLDHGAILDLLLQVPDEPLVAKVRVADAYMDGAAAASSALRFLAGLEFVGLPAGEQARLMRFLDQERRRRSADAAS